MSERRDSQKKVVYNFQKLVQERMDKVMTRLKKLWREQTSAELNNIAARSK